jgi:gliding motility-associated-like protein
MLKQNLTLNFNTLAFLYGANVQLNGIPSGATFMGTGVSGDIFEPLQTGFGRHTISYRFTSQNVSTFEARKTITVIREKIKVYDLITPNGDGQNDVLTVESFHAVPEDNLGFSNHWGNLFFSSSSYKNDWNGGGLPDGTYYYVLKTHEDGKIYKGGLVIMK